jgi:hypothetical protein
MARGHLDSQGRGKIYRGYYTSTTLKNKFFFLFRKLICLKFLNEQLAECVK